MSCLLYLCSCLGIHRTHFPIFCAHLEWRLCDFEQELDICCSRGQQYSFTSQTELYTVHINTSIVVRQFKKMD